jgi:hypothetical protein
VLSDALARWLRAMPEEARSFDVAKVKGLIKAVEAEDSRGVAPGWDAGAQKYLALQPLRLALRGLDPKSDDARLKSELEALFGRLHFPRGFDSPRRFDPATLRGGR